MRSLNQIFQSLFRNLLFLLIGAYRTIGTTHLGGSCRFEPCCSEYALEAIRLHPPHRAVRLIGSRVLRCRPGGSFGFDPVPRSTETFSHFSTSISHTISPKEMT